MGDVADAVQRYVDDLNLYMEDLSGPGPYSKFVLGDDVDVAGNEQRRGNIELKWNGGLEVFKLYAGIAVSVKSAGHKALIQARRKALTSSLSVSAVCRSTTA